MFRKVCILVLGVILLTMTGMSSAVLIGVQPSFPVGVYDGGGSLNYDATSDILSINAYPLMIRFSAMEPPRFIRPVGGLFSISIQVQVDDTGALVGGVPGDDLVVMGQVDKDGDGIVDFSGILLAGEVGQFGSHDTGGPTDLYDFRFRVTGGELAEDFYYLKDIGLTVGSEASSFGGDFTVNFTGGAKGIYGPIDSVCDLDVIVEGCVQIPPPVVTESDCKGKLIQMTLMYTGENCDASSNNQSRKKAKCMGDPALAEPVSILITDKKGKKIWASASNVNVGDTILVDSANAAHKKGKKKGAKRIGPATKATIFNAAGEKIQQVYFRTNCDEPLNVGDQFGSLRIMSLVSTKGGEVVYEEPEEPNECIKELPYVATPHCQGKIEVLRLRYTGGGCAASDHTQDAGKVTCTGDAGSASPVRIVVTDPSGSNLFLDTGAPASITLGDVVDAIGLNAGLNELKGETNVKVYDEGGALIEEVSFHTSCSQPVNLGDQFGSFEIYGMETTSGGTVADETAVDYTYTVTNSSDIFQLTNVTVVDDAFGVVPGSPIALLQPGESATLTLTAPVSQETTNTVTAIGYVLGLIPCEAIDSETITEAAAPVEPEMCTSKLKSLLLQYTGPDVPDATITIVADTFNSNPVIYTGINLTAGTILSSPTENGFTIDASAHSKTDLGANVSISINDAREELHTSCSVPIIRQAPAPLNKPVKGDPSANWLVVDFTEKD